MHRIRQDHPRLFLNAQTWPDVRERALGPERQWYLSVKARVDELLRNTDQKDRLEIKEYGQQAAWSAFFYRMERQARNLELTRKCLDASLCFCDQCCEQKKSVNWYSASRVHATLAWDWIYEDLSPTQRRDFLVAAEGHAVHLRAPSCARGFHARIKLRWTRWRVFDFVVNNNISLPGRQRSAICQGVAGSEAWFICIP